MSEPKLRFVDWLRVRLGTDRWVVARASAKRREKYDLFLSPAAFKALEEKYKSEVPS